MNNDHEHQKLHMESSPPTDLPPSDTEEEKAEEEEFQDFFFEVTDKMPNRIKKAVLSSYRKTRAQADELLAKLMAGYESVFEDFLEGVDSNTRKKTYRIIHAAALTSAIVAFSPIPFSDALLLVPIQLTMMRRLHRAFGQSFVENLPSSITKELALVSLGRSAVGNIMKFFPGVGSIAGAAVNASVAVALTTALGWVTVKMLNDDEDIFNDLLSFEGQFKRLFDALRNIK